jgi:hypothetical protein
MLDDWLEAGFTFIDEAEAEDGKGLDFPSGPQKATKDPSEVVVLQQADLPTGATRAQVDVDSMDLRPGPVVSRLAADGQEPTSLTTERARLVDEAKAAWQRDAEELSRLLAEVETMRGRIRYLQKESQRKFNEYRDLLAGGMHPYSHVFAGFTPPEGDWWQDIPIDDLRLVEINGIAMKRHSLIRSIAPTIGLLYEFIVRGAGLHSIQILRGPVAKAIEARLKLWFDRNRTEEQYLRNIEDDPPLSAEELFTRQMRSESMKKYHRDRTMKEAAKGKLSTEQLKRMRKKLVLNQQCLLVRFNDLRTMSDWGVHERDLPCYEAGRRDRAKGVKVIDCIYPAGPSQDAWIWGWITEDKVIRNRANG